MGFTLKLEAAMMPGIIDWPWTFSQRAGTRGQPLLVRQIGAPQANARRENLQNISALHQNGHSPTLSAISLKIKDSTAPGSPMRNIGAASGTGLAPSSGKDSSKKYAAPLLI